MEIVIYICLVVMLALCCWRIHAKANAKDKELLDSYERLEKQIDAFCALQSRRTELFISSLEEINNELES